MSEPVNKNVMVALTQTEYDEATMFKKTHGRITWREMLMDYVDIIHEFDELNEEEKKGE